MLSSLLLTRHRECVTSYWPNYVNKICLAYASDSHFCATLRML